MPLHHQSSRNLPSRQGREKPSLYPLLWIWTTYPVVEVLKSKNLLRLTRLLFPAWTEVFWTTGVAAASLSPLVMFFSLFSLIVIILAMRKIKLKKKKKKKNQQQQQKQNTNDAKGKEELTILTSTGGFLVIKVLYSRQWTKPPSC